jgi:carbon monoxide dehydrogenase subunit G
MPELAITRRIHAPVEIVWAVLDDYGAVQQWSPGVKRSHLTSAGTVGVGTTRHCDFAFGGATERIDAYEPFRRMTVNLVETFRLPISGALADFMLSPSGSATDVTIRYSYSPNLLGRLLGSLLARQVTKGINGIATGLQQRCERIATSQALESES